MLPLYYTATNPILMALDSLPFQNPWDVGGKYHNELPWAKDAQRFGFDYGNDYFEPKTQAEIRDEGLLQMAILALVLAAPAIAGAVGGGGGSAAAGTMGAGGASGGAAVGTTGVGGVSGTVAGSGLAAGMGASAQAGGVVAGQAAVAATGGGFATGVSGSLALGAIGVALYPFLQPGAAEQIQAQAKLGTVTLNRFFNEIAPVHGQSFENQFEWQPMQVHPAMQLLDDLVKDPVPSQSFLQRSPVQSSPFSTNLTHQILNSLERMAPAPISPALVTPLLPQNPAASTGGPPDFLIDKDGKVTPLMRVFLENAYGFSTESIEETVHRTIEPAWTPGDITRGFIAEVAFRGGADAITLGVQVIYKDDFWYGSTSEDDWISIMVHEHTHRQEIWKYNDIGWYSAYLVESATTDYWKLSFEQRAYDNDARASSFLNSADGQVFIKILKNPAIPEKEKTLWVTMYALREIREPYLQKEIQDVQNEIQSLIAQIHQITGSGGTIPMPLSNKLRLLQHRLQNLQLELKQVQADIQQLNYLGYK